MLNIETATNEELEAEINERAQRSGYAKFAIDYPVIVRCYAELTRREITK